MFEDYLNKYNNKDTFKKVIYVFNINNGGIGDYLKFFVCLLELCMKNDILLYLYINHLIGKYIKLKYPVMQLDNEQYGLCQKEQIPRIKYLLKNHDIKKYHIVSPCMVNKILYEYTEINNFPLNNIFYFTENIKNKSLMITCNKKYISIHLRLGDKFLETDKNFVVCQNDTREYDESKIFNFLEHNNDKNIYFFCDNDNYRQKIKKNFDFVNITNLKIGHTSLSNTTEEECFNSVVEFYILSNSEKIYKASNSGFSLLASRFHNIEICDI